MSKLQRDSKKRIAFAVRLFSEDSGSGKLPDEIHVVPTGKWQHPVYEEMEISSADIAEFVRNFKDGVRNDLPITAGHDNGMSGGELPAVGWYKDLIDRGVKGLYAVVEWNPEGERLLRERSYKYFSSEFYEEYADPENGERRKHVLVGGALTNKPYFKELDPVITFSEPGIMNQFSDPMDLKTILAKKAEELSADEKAFVREHKAELDADQQSAFASVLEDTNPEPEDKPEDKPEDAPADKPADEVQASEKNKGKVITMSEAEVSALRKAANDGAKAFAEVEKMKLNEAVGRMVFSESNKNGRILPKQKEAVAAFMFSLSEKQRDQFKNIVNNLPKADSSIFSELGDGGAAAASAEGIAEEVKTAALAEVKASEGSLSYSDAVLKVFKEKPELKQRYYEALGESSN